MTSIAIALASAPLNVDQGGLGYRAHTLAMLKAADVPDTQVLASVKAWLQGKVDGAAEKLRESLLTGGAGQAMEYQAVQAEAIAALASPTNATAADYPMLAASIGIDIDPSTKAAATDIFGVARAVLASATSWATFGAAIRAARLKGKAAIDAAADLAGAVAAFDAVAWPDTTS